MKDPYCYAKNKDGQIGKHVHVLHKNVQLGRIESNYAPWGSSRLEASKERTRSLRQRWTNINKDVGDRFRGGSGGSVDYPPRPTPFLNIL